jgi:hypothetical protein
MAHGTISLDGRVDASAPVSWQTALPMPRTSDSDEQAAKAGKPSRGDVRAQVAFESARRARLGVPAIAGGVLFLLGGIIVNATLRPLPSVGVVQGLAPALRGEANPAVSPGAAEVRFVDHHAFGLIAGNLLQAVAILLLVLILLFLLEAVRFRRPETSAAARPLVLAGGAAMVFVSIAHPVAEVINAHDFATGHDFTAEAVNHALTQSTALEVTEYLGLLGGLALAAGMIVVALGATRTGLMARWMLYLGIFSALLAFTPFGLALGEVQQLVPAFWMVAAGILLMGRWAGGDPPAWAAGEAVPWPSSAQVREERQAAYGSGRGGGRGGRAQPDGGGGTQPDGGGRAQPDGGGRAQPDGGGGTQPNDGGRAQGTGDVAPEPVQPARGGGGSRRRRKRGARG